MNQTTKTTTARKIAQVCDGGPRDGQAFQLRNRRITRIRSGDGFPGSYRKTGRRDRQGAKVWNYEPEPRT
jgi:hypothetical protein